MTKVSNQQLVPVPPTKVWEALRSLLPSRNRHYDYWWRLGGVHLAHMVEAAGYTPQMQYEALLFHYHWVVPYMGPEPAPSTGGFTWPCVLTLQGLPVEYSWKWNTATKKPEVRYTIEAKGQFTGTTMDPLNQDATREMLHRLQGSFPGVDLTWTNHLLATLFEHDRSKHSGKGVAEGPPPTTTIMVASELKAAGLVFKTYLIPRWLGVQPGSITPWRKAIAGICPVSPAADALFEFLSSPQGQSLSPTMLAVDNVSPVKSRLKFYFQAPNTSFLSTRNIMTLGGRIPVPEERLQELRTLIIAVTGVGQDFPEDAALPISHQFNPPIKDANNDRTLALPGYGYYFDIAPDQALPEIKIFIRLSVNGLDDLSVARGLTGWMEARGRGVYCRAFLSMLQSLCSYRQLDEVKGVHTHVSCLFKKNGDLDITSYLAPDISTRPVMLRQEAQGVSNGNGVVEVRSGHI